ncbi:MAG TPA: trypsin-like peptidase domain-containing protein [Candidatus Dormibacteraeota bacterium]|nr:trypsin-like peptidase domain-containing protein [Candidatus Dormibacteraeota bacterium]
MKYTTAFALGLLVATACTTNPIWSRTSPTPSAAATPTAVVAIPVVSPAPAMSAAFDPARVVRVLGPAVAEILVTQSTGTRGIGTGFVIAHERAASYLVTNNHVVAGATRVVVLMPDGKHFVAKVQGTDPIQDIAVVKVDDGSLPLAQFGDSTKLVVGQQVVAIGSPHGNQGSVTSGIISALHRTLTATSGPRTPTEDLPDVLQTDAAINPGNSGGPLADGDGNVIGVNTAVDATGQGIGYAIPSLIAKRIAQDLIAGRTPGHPYMGVCYQSEDAFLASGKDIPGYGVLVTSTLPGSPAAKAGLKSGDLIEKVDAVELNNGQTLGGAIQPKGPGDTVRLTILRSGATTTVPLTLADRSSASKASCATTP